MPFNLVEITILTSINAFSALLIIIVLANSFKDKLYRWFTIMTMFLIGWVDFAYLGYAEKSLDLSIIFYRINWAFVSAFILAAYFFYLECFLNIKKRKFKWGVILLSSIFIYFSLFTGNIIESVVSREWGNEINFGFLNDYFSLFTFLFSCVLIYFFISKYFTLEQREKKKVMFFLIGTFFLILFNVIFNVLSPIILKTARYQHFGDYSAVIFLGFTSYAMLTRKFLNVKVALTALFISVIGVLLIIDILVLSNSLLEQGLKTIIFIFFVIISVILVRSVLNEIHQREQLAEINKALDKSKQRYFDLASEQKDVIDVMGHEIRTPLTAIVQEIKIHQKYTLPIEKKLLDEAKGKKELSKILPLLLDTIKTTDRASSHAVALVTDMLETARLDKKRFELNYEKFDLIDTIQSNVELMKKTVDADTDAVKCDISFEKPAMKELIVEADKTRIGQAVFALLSNAIKYHDPNKDTVKVSISLIQKNNHAQIRITDNGIGIAAEDISKLGKKFVRLNPKTDGNLKRPGGTGLGLFVVKGIMEYHHGTMQIESDGVGKGSVFTLKFPINKINNGKNEQTGETHTS